MLVWAQRSGRTTSFCRPSECAGLEETPDSRARADGDVANRLRRFVPARGALHEADNRLAGVKVNRAGGCTGFGIVPENELAFPLLLDVSL